MSPGTNGLLGVVLLGLIILLMTSPGWIVGKWVSRRRSTLRVPAAVRYAWARWTLWAICGVVAAFALTFGANPVAPLEPAMRFSLLAVGGIGWALALAMAFYISWTTSVAKATRQETAARTPDAAAANPNRCGPTNYVGPPVGWAEEASPLSVTAPLQTWEDEYPLATPHPN